MGGNLTYFEKIFNNNLRSQSLHVHHLHQHHLHHSSSSSSSSSSLLSSSSKSPSSSSISILDCQSNISQVFHRYHHSPSVKSVCQSVTNITSRVSGDVRYSISWVFLALHHKLYLCICTASRQVPPGQVPGRTCAGTVIINGTCPHGICWLAKILFSSLQKHFTIFSQPNGGMCCDCN